MRRMFLNLYLSHEEAAGPLPGVLKDLTGRCDAQSLGPGRAAGGGSSTLCVQLTLRRALLMSFCDLHV